MNTISNTNVVQTQEVLVSPIFSLPLSLDKGSFVVDNIIGDTSAGEAGQDSEDLVISEDDAADSDSQYVPLATLPESKTPISPSADESISNGLLGVPSGFVIVGQKIRQTTDGRTVVDVTISCTDVYDALNYEVRVTKV